VRTPSLTALIVRFFAQPEQLLWENEVAHLTAQPSHPGWKSND
jgi:hypothetical protein